MSLQIIRGRRNAPIRGVLYATAGFGKTSLAAALPAPVFIDVEGSSERYDVARIDARTESEVVYALNQLIADPQGFGSVVIDTIDWLESAIGDAICREQKVKSIAEASGGYGKGYVELGRRMATILGLCDLLVSKGLHVLLIAHSMVKKVSPPDQLESYDRYELALDQKNCALPICEWAELVLFGKFETTLIKTKEKKIKADLGEQSRMLYTTNTAAWYAKNRFALPSEIIVPAVEFSDDGVVPPAILPAELAAVFAGKQQTRAAAPQIAASVAGNVRADSAQEAGSAVQSSARALSTGHAAEVCKHATAEQIATLTTYANNSVAGPIIAKAFDHYNALDASELTEEQAAKVITRCQEEMNKAAEKKPDAAGPGFPWRAQQAVADWLKANAEKVETYAVGKGWIKAGQSWADIPGEHVERIISRAEAFAKAAGIPVMGGAK